MTPKKRAPKSSALSKPTAETSFRMSRIRSTNTKIEIILRKALSSRGHRYRKNYREIPGRPDIAFVSKKLAIFCDSSFWHGRDWPVLQKRLKTNRSFWLEKIRNNMARDVRVKKDLVALEWQVIRFWEEDIHTRLDWCVAKVEKALTSPVQMKTGKTTKTRRAIARLQKT
jgi:DNA mismatch endonuclease (patch repair protein)